MWAMNIIALNIILLKQVCKKVGLSVAQSEQLLEESTTPVVKEKLKETTQRALDHGVNLFAGCL